MKRNKEFKLFLVTLTILFSISFVLSVNYDEYEYVSKIKVNCEEYKGYARFELPNEYNSLNPQRSYMDIEYYIYNSQNEQYYKKINNWFVKQIEGHDISEVEKIFDNNYETYLINEDKNQISFTFESPSPSRIDKISLDLRDSLIDDLKIYNSLGNKIDFTQNTQDFHYEFFLNTTINTYKLKFQIDYKDIIKIKEVAFYNLEAYKQKSYCYVYVNNDCMKEHNFYFGRYGESNAKIGQKTLPVEFSTSVSTFVNTLYDNDFDNDTILNDFDNCLYTANKDQKDINYNNIGDACEDDDSDGIVNLIDNCINNYNTDQLDNDKDGIGNACDDTDERFFEQNKYLVFIFAGIISLIFLVIAIIIMKNRDK